MLFMVIERFSDGVTGRAGERFASKGRMLPEGVTYEASWIADTETQCFQLMHAPDRATLDIWLARWSDLVDFEVVPVVASKAFWSQRQ